MLCWQWYTCNKCLVVPIRWWAWSWDNVCALWPVNSGENTGAFITWMTSGGREIEVGEGLKFQNSELDYSFEHWTSVKGGAHSRFADTLDIPTSGKACMSPALKRSSAVQHFKRSNVIEICDRVILDFYKGLSHTVDREIFTLKITRMKNFRVVKFSWFRLIRKMFLTVDDYNMDKRVFQYCNWTCNWYFTTPCKQLRAFCSALQITSVAVNKITITNYCVWKPVIIT